MKLLLCFLISFNIFAYDSENDPMIAAPPMSIPPPPKYNFSVNYQVYDGSAGGLRKYLESDLKKRNKKLYRYLDPVVTKLENDNIKAWTSLILLGGAGLVYSSLGLAQDCYDSENNLDSACQSRADQQIFVGGGVMLVGAGLFWFFRPDREDFLDFLNLHNRKRRKHPMKWNLGLIRRDVLGGQLAFSF